jgi:DnaJ-domain-containing protein 1
MTDFFAVFGLQPRPVIDVALLSNLFASKSKSVHPDHGADGDFATLNEAFQTLAHPVTRVWHLLALSGGEAKPTSARAEVNAWFGQVANSLQQFDQMLQPLSQETSSLLRAIKIGEGRVLVDELEKLSEDLGAEKQGLLEALAQIDARWPSDLAADRSALAQIACDLRFVEKWLAQIAERRLRFQELL